MQRAEVIIKTQRFASLQKSATNLPGLYLPHPRFPQPNKKMTSLRAVDFVNIPFTEFTDVKVRMAMVNNTQYLAIRDLVRVLSRRNPSDANRIWRDMSVDFKQELKAHSLEIQFMGSHQHYQPVVDFHGAFKLISSIDGANARHRRKRIMEILIAHYAGDKRELAKSMHAQEEPASPQPAQEPPAPPAPPASPASPASPAQPQQIQEPPASPAPPQQIQEQPAPQQSPQQSTEPSYVYAFASDAFPGIIKIGRATDIQSRLSTINTSMADNDFKLVTYFPTYNPSRDESDAHKHFAEFRTKREFFKIEKPQLLAYFAEMNNAFLQQKPRRQ